MTSKLKHARTSICLARTSSAKSLRQLSRNWGEHRLTRFVVKQIIAIVKPFLAEKVLEVLQRSPLEALSVREVKGFGRQKSYLDQYSETEFDQAFLPKVEISFWVAADRSAEVIEKVVAVARTGRIGDGKIMVLSASSHDQVIEV